MLGAAAAKQVERVGQQVEDCGERGFGSGGASGKVDDERLADAAADAAAEGGERSLPDAFSPHALAQAFDEAVAYQAGRLRSDVAEGQARASGGDDEVSLGGVMAQRVGDFAKLVRQRGRLRFGHAGALQQPRNSRPGTIFLGAGGTAVADGEHDGFAVAMKSRSHRTSLIATGQRVFLRATRPRPLHWKGGSRGSGGPWAGNARLWVNLSSIPNV